MFCARKQRTATAETTNQEPIANGVLHSRPPNTIRSPGAPLRCCQSATDGRAEARHDPVDMRHAAPIKPARLKASARDQQNEFIKHRCQQLRGLLQNHHRGAAIASRQNQILMEVKARWPNAHARRLGELFNRKANSIRDLLASLKPKSPAGPLRGRRSKQCAGFGRPWRLNRAKPSSSTGRRTGLLGRHVLQPPTPNPSDRNL